MHTACANKRACTHALTHTHTHTLKQTNTCTHARTHQLMHSDERTQTHTNTHSQNNTHLLVYWMTWPSTSTPTSLNFKGSDDVGHRHGQVRIKTQCHSISHHTTTAASPRTIGTRPSRDFVNGSATFSSHFNRDLLVVIQHEDSSCIYRLCRMSCTHSRQRTRPVHGHVSADW